MRFKLLFALFFCLFTLVSTASSAPSPFEGLTITRVDLKDVRGGPLPNPARIADLMDTVKPGSVFSSPAIRGSLQLLYLKGVFKDIRVEGYPDAGGVRLEYVFTPVTIVDSIAVTGNDEFSADAIRDAIPRVAGRELREDNFPAIKSALLALYESAGFYGAAVDLSVHPLPDRDRVALRIAIDEGEPTRIEEITFAGNQAVNADSLLWAIKSRPGGKFQRDQLLDADREAIVGKYTKEGYPEARVGPVDVHFEGRRVSIIMHIAEGRHAEIRFKGNEAFSRSKLYDALLIWQEHDLSDELLDSSAHRIRTMYRDSGYADATVDVSKVSSAQELAVTFSIQEGPRISIRKITVQGNTVLSSKQLRHDLASEESGFRTKLGILPWYKTVYFRQDLLDKDADAVRDKYAEAGYLSADVKIRIVRTDSTAAPVADRVQLPEAVPGSELFSARKESEAVIVFEVTEGALSRTGTVAFEGSTVFTATELEDRIPLKPGAPFNERLLDEGKYAILSAYTGKGYLYARVDAERTMKNGTVDVRYRIAEDRPVHIGRIILRGNERTHDYVITRELLVKSGDSYDYGAILASQQRIYRLGYFRQARFEPIQRGDKNYLQDLLLTVEERPAGAVEFGVGYGDLDRLRGFVELSYRNLWGQAKYTSLRFEESNILKRAIFNYQEPWFLDRKIEAKFSLIWSDADKLNSDTREIYYRSRKTAASVGLEKTFGHFTPSLTYQFENVVNYDVQQAAQVTPEDSGRVLVSSLTPALLWDMRDDVFNPRRGALFGVVAKEALKPLYSEASFHKVTVQGSVFFPIDSSVLALSARSGMAWRYGKTPVIPLHERFYAGGSTTVRGFTQDSIGPTGGLDSKGHPIPQGGDAMVIFNIEFRINPGEGFGVVLFTDAGNVWPDQRINLRDLRSSYGIGLRYGTPVGPFRIDYGQKVHMLPGESPGELHFNIGNTF